jgi:hypothetical protein
MSIYLRRTFLTALGTAIASAGVAMGLTYAAPDVAPFKGRRRGRRPSPILDSDRRRSPFHAVLGDAYSPQLQNRQIPRERTGKGL